MWTACSDLMRLLACLIAACSRFLGSALGLGLDDGRLQPELLSTSFANCERQLWAVEKLPMDLSPSPPRCMPAARPDPDGARTSKAKEKRRQKGKVVHRKSSGSADVAKDAKKAKKLRTAAAKDAKKALPMKKLATVAAKDKKLAQPKKLATVSNEDKKLAKQRHSSSRFVKQLKKRCADSSQTLLKRLKSGNEDGCITVGSDCCGYGSDLLALKLLRVKFRLVFTAEKDPSKRELLAKLHKEHRNALVHYNDIQLRDNAKAPQVDIFITGAPCPAFSHAGKRLGLKDLQDRGVVIYHSLDYVLHQRPRTVIIENVVGMKTGAMKPNFDDIMAMLMDMGYTVSWSTINTKDHGVPHSRPRLYIVGIRTKAMRCEMQWPKSIGSAPIEMFLDLAEASCKLGKGQELAKKNVKAAQKKWGEAFDNEMIFVDISASEVFQHSARNVCPCITKARGKRGTHVRHAWGMSALLAMRLTCLCLLMVRAPRSMGYWISKLSRKTTLYELAGLQGLPRLVLEKMLSTSLGPSAIGGALGDAMSINVLMRVLAAALYASGLVEEGLPDIWAKSHMVVGRMPDALYSRHGLLDAL